MQSAEMVSDMISASLIQKLAYSAVSPAAINPARRPTTRMASRPTAPTTAAPSTAMSSRCRMIGSWPHETGARTRAVSGGWSAAGEPLRNGCSKPRPSASTWAWVE